MVKNRMAEEFNKEMVMTLEYNSMASSDIAKSHFPNHLLNDSNLSKGAQRNFE